MRKAQFTLIRISVVAGLSLLAGFAGYRTTADTVSTFTFKGYQQRAVWNFASGGASYFGIYWCTQGVTGNGKPQPVNTAELDSEVDTATAWTEVFGSADVPDSAITTVNGDLKGIGSCNATFSGTKWVFDPTTWTSSSSAVTISANATMSDPTDIVSGVSRTTEMDRQAGVMFRVHSVGKHGFSNSTATGGVSVNGAPFIPNGSTLWGPVSFISNVSNGTFTKIKM